MDIKMSTTKKIKIEFDGPILHGTISTAMAKCGKENCHCKKDPKSLHGPYYRWTGKIDGKITTRTLSKEVAKICEQRIRNYEKLQKMIDGLLKEGSDSAPWKELREE